MSTRSNYSSFMSFVFLLLCLSFNNHLSQGIDTISVSQPLFGDQTIVSAGGTFELGFYKPGNPSSYYISMWYKNVSTQTIVWVANREAPISNIFSSQLMILDGNLVLLNESQSPVWSTNQNSSTSNSVEAVLLDDGNLVLRESGKNSTEPIWQSFDHPTHTFLPGSKISYNKKTKTHQSLVSWKNVDDPAPGPFSISLDADNLQYLLAWNGSEQYWTSGPWNGQIFSLVPEMRTNYIYNFSYVDNENESYFTYSLYNPSIISRCIMDVSGQIKQLTWLESTRQWNLFWSQPRQQCEVYGICGAFGTCNDASLPFCSCLEGFVPKSGNDWNLGDYSGGCQRKMPLQCGDPTATNKERDGFLKMQDMRLPDGSLSMAVRTAGECQLSCLNNCTCNAYTYDSNGCTIWIGELINLQRLTTLDGAGKTLYVRLRFSELEAIRKTRKGVVTGVIVGSVAGVAVLIGVVVFIIYARKKSSSVMSLVEGSLVEFGYNDLRRITKKFSEKLGGGGFGSVYKGTLSDSTILAVKKLEGIRQGEKQFQTEINTIGNNQSQHVNLIQLCGFCSQGNKKFLVYDYMQNGSLDTHLFHGRESTSTQKVLDWKTRYQIALGTARGLAHLHDKGKDCIIHCDIKPENILLDKNFCPKITDFCLAKLVGREFSRILTTLRGTRGYLAPEWITGMPITPKVDVYSYGMVLFEIISGKRNIDQSADGKGKFFPTWAASVVTVGENVMSLLDHRLNGKADAEELRRMCRVACWCIQDDENLRPTMDMVVLILQGVLDVNLPPTPHFLQILVDE